MIASILWIASVLAPATWTVDDDGPADFASIAAAIPQVAPGDTLLVEPGAYGGFILTSPLTILGRAGASKPTVTGPVEIVSAAEATLAGLSLNRVVVRQASGRVAIDDCVIAGPSDAAALEVTSCEQVLVTRTSIAAGFMSAMPGASIQGSNVTLGTCTLQGGHGADFSFPIPADGAFGLVAASSRVVLADTSVSGGAAGFNDSSQQGSSGGAIDATHGCEVVVRGSMDNVLSAGSASPFGTPGFTLLSQSGSTIVVSGVTVIGTTASPGGSIVQPSAPEPWLRVIGNDAPGQTRTVELYGPPASQALLFASLAPAYLPSPLVELPLWFDPSAILAVRPLTTISPSTPVSLDVPIPPSTLGIEGVTLEVQAVFPSLPGTLSPTAKNNTNGANLIVRF